MQIGAQARRLEPEIGMRHRPDRAEKRVRARPVRRFRLEWTERRERLDDGFENEGVALLGAAAGARARVGAIVTPDRGEREIADDVIDEPRDEEVEAPRRIPLRRTALDSRGEVGLCAVDRRIEQRALVAEMVVDRRRADADRGRDRLHARMRHAAPVKELDRSAENLLASIGMAETLPHLR